MPDTHPTGLLPWITTTDPVALTALAVGAAVALGALLLVTNLAARRLTAVPRERARAAAAQWAQHRARAARTRARVRARSRAVATSFLDTPRARRALLGVLAFTALAATILSAHGIQDSLTAAGLTSWWVRVCGFAAFEGLMLVMFALSWWHRTTSQDGHDIYGTMTWAGSILLALVGYHGGDDWIYAVFAPMSAVGFHLMSGAERRRRGGAPSWAAKAAAALRRRWDRFLVWLGRTPTSIDTDRIDAERRLNRIAVRRVKAHRASAFTRAARVRAFERAVNAAQARGLLDAAGRATVAELVATLTSAMDALSPEAVTALGIAWGAPAPVVLTEPRETPAPERGAAMARAALERVVEVDALERSAPVVPRAQSAQRREQAVEWCVQHYRTEGRMPSGPDVATRFATHPGNARKWIAIARGKL